MQQKQSHPIFRIAAALCVGMFCPVAQAHVKWFADWSMVICPPRDPMRVLSLPLWQMLFAASILSMALLGWTDARLAASPGRWRNALQQVHGAAMPHAMSVLRVGLSLYWLMVALTLATPVYLTPELSAPSGVRWLQVACAVVVLHRSSSWLAGLGLLALYAMATVQHGWFHLLDYPLFFFLGIILLLPKMIRHHDDALSLDLLRWSAAVTLLWGGVEKFAFPEWSFSMLNASPTLSLGVSPEAAMYLYGFGELALAFGLLLFGVGSQVAALLLLIVFVAAVPPFGWVDFVGHSGIMVALVLLVLTRPSRPVLRTTAWRNALLHGIAFPATVLGLWAMYTSLHGVYLRSLTPDPWVETQARVERAEVRATQSGRPPVQQPFARPPDDETRLKLTTQLSR